MSGISGIYGNGVALEEKVLDYLWLRQNVTLHNIANNETPEFKSQYLTFEESMADKIKNASAGQASAAGVRQAIQSSRPALHVTQTESTRLDGNNVDMSQEQIDLVRTAYEYQYLANSITNELNRLKNAAKSF